MGKAFLDLAGKKWFVPAVLVLMGFILFSSLLEKPSAAGSSATDAEEAKLASLCDRLLGTNSTSVMFSYSEGAVDAFFGGEKSRRAVLGVAVLCEGGDEAEVQLKIYRLIKSLYAVSGSQISICGYG